MIKTDTLCNENNYGTEKQRETRNIMLYAFADSISSFYIFEEVFGKI